MKKVLILFLILLTCGCNVVEEPQKEKTPTKVLEEKVVEEQYVDLNNVKVGLYTRSTGKYSLWHEYKGTFKVGTDLNTFQIVPSIEENLTYKGSYVDYIKGLWDQVENEYKLGIILEYTLENGENIKHVIYDPSNTLEYIDFVQVYLYDAVTHKNDKWYSHITESEFNENSYITSFKLTGGARASEITYPVKLSVFTYDSDDDFVDDTYRGNSIYSIEIVSE